MINEKLSENINIFEFTNFFQTFKDVHNLSIMRSLMNQIIRKIKFKGKVIDIGGGKKSNYINLLKCDEYISLNIDKKIEPDILINVNQKFPLNNNLFDQCLLFNVLEHIYDWNFLFEEIVKVLKKGAKINIIIPFLYPIHGAPNDYKRVTSQYMLEFLKKYSFENIIISPISYGPFTNSQLVGYTHRKINGPLSQIAVVLDKIFQLFFKQKYFNYNKRCPLFYYVKANLK